MCATALDIVMLTGAELVTNAPTLMCQPDAWSIVMLYFREDSSRMEILWLGGQCHPYRVL